MHDDDERTNDLPQAASTRLRIKFVFKRDGVFNQTLETSCVVLTRDAATQFVVELYFANAGSIATRLCV